MDMAPTSSWQLSSKVEIIESRSFPYVSILSEGDNKLIIILHYEIGNDMFVGLVQNSATCIESIMCGVGKRVFGLEEEA
jgi:hypothetical protein